MSLVQNAIALARSRPKLAAAALGSLVLAAGAVLNFVSSPSGEYQGFWSGLQTPEGSSRRVAQALPSCPTPKCFNVYVAPWCPHCRDAVPVILSTRDYLNQHNVHTNIIVGLDKPQALRDYAKVFGPDTVIDDEGALGQGGVPHFYVTDKTGGVLREEAGVPEDIPDAKTFASLFGLP